MDTIRQTVSAVMAQLTAEHGKAVEQGPAAWIKRLFSSQERRHVRFGYYRKAVLGLEVDSSSWLYHLNLRRQDLLAHLRQLAPEVKDLRLRLGGQNSCCKRRRK